MLKQERILVVKYSKLLQERGLTKGTGGNISVIDRQRGLVAITPSAVEYDELVPQDVAVINLEGKVIEGNYEPSSEKDMHLECYKRREDIGAVVHTHSLYATILACLGQNIPPVHYLIGFAGGSVKCVPYKLFGTKELALAAVEGLGNNNAALLGNHGLLAVGPDLYYAFNVAEETEFVAEIYYKAKLFGDIRLLTEEDMKKVMEKFKSYGKKAPIVSE